MHTAFVAENAELDALVKLSLELKSQKMTFDASQKKSSMKMRSLSESIRKLYSNLEQYSFLIQQVLFIILSANILFYCFYLSFLGARFY